MDPVANKSVILESGKAFATKYCMVLFFRLVNPGTLLELTLYESPPFNKNLLKSFLFAQWGKMTKNGKKCEKSKKK